MAAIEDGCGTCHTQCNRPAGCSLSHTSTLSISICCSFLLCHYSYSQLIATFTFCSLSPMSFHLNICLLPRFPMITSHLQGPLLRRASHLGARCDNRYHWHSPPGLLQSTPASLYLFPFALSRCIPPVSTTVPCLNVSHTFSLSFTLFIHSPVY